MPPRFTPFYQSLANRGMRQTNNNINNIGNPSGNVMGQGTQPGGATYIPGEGGSQGGMDNLPPGYGVGSQPGQGWGLDYPGSITGGGATIDFSHILDKPISSPILGRRDPITDNNFQSIPGGGFSGPIGDGGEIDQPLMPTDELPAGWTWEYINGEWIPQGPGGSNIAPGPGGEDFFTGAGNVLDVPDWMNPGMYGEGNTLEEGQYGGALGQGIMWDKYGTMEGGFDVNNDGVVDALDIQMAAGMTEEDFASMMGFGAPNQPYSNFSEYFQDLTQQYGQQWEDTLSQEDLQQLEYDFMGGNLMNQPDYSSQYSQQGFLENLQQYINPMQSSAQQFTGGGGQAGTAAKKLHYPGTSGGFASVGSGMDASTLQELLKQYQG